jgi:uncharacterized protein (TIGR00296 family)
MDVSDGIIAVKAARRTIEAETEGRDPNIVLPHSFDADSGVFVTLKTYPSMELRGCIGYPDPILPLCEALVHSAQSACHDPRFPDLSRSETDYCVVEVTILTPPKMIDVKNKAELPGKIVIGRDGLIITFGRRRGLLLPQVPVEWRWNAEEYLEQLSIKAGLPPDAWKMRDSEIYSFAGEIFSESTPGGDIVRG